MAINPKVSFPTKFGIVTAEWPYGEPQNISAPGDLTGSPWEVRIVKDLMGLQQALLIAAGIVPTDVPETAIASQYLEALNTLYPRTVEHTVLVATSSLAGVKAMRTLGYATAGDGGEAAWYATGVVNAGLAGTQDFAAGLVYDVAGVEFAIFPGAVNPRQYGAKGDGVTNDLPEVQDAVDTQFSRGGGTVFFTPGTYKFDSQLTVQDKVSLQGTGRDLVTLDFSGAGGAFPDGACIYGTGSTFILPVLGADAPQNAVEVTFALAHGLVKDDLFLFIDPRDFSFHSGGAAFRSGEFAVVGDAPTTTTVRLTAPLVATNDQAIAVGFPTGYEAAEIVMEGVLPLHFSVRDLTLIGTGATSEAGIVARYGRDCNFVNLKIKNTPAFGMALNRCYESSVRDLHHFEANEPSGDRNGVTISHSQRCWLTRVTGISTTSLVLTGAETSDGNTPPNRFIYMQAIEGLEGGRGLGTLRLKGNSEFIYVYDSYLRGCVVGGDNIHLANCVIRGMAADMLVATARGQALLATDLVGFTHSFTDCRFEAAIDVGSSVELIGITDSASHLARAGQFQIRDCTIDMLGFTGEVLRIELRDTTLRPDVLIRDCQITGGDNVKILPDGAGPAGCTRVEVRQCTFQNCNLDIAGAGLCQIHDNAMSGGYLQYSDTTVGFSSTMRVEVINNTVRDSPADGIFIQSRDITDLVLANNVSLANANLFGSLRVNPTSGFVARMLMANNLFGDDLAVPTQSYSWDLTNITSLVSSRNVDVGNIGVNEASVTGGTVYEHSGDETQTTTNALTLLTDSTGFHPNVDATGDLGKSGKRWAEVYSNMLLITRLRLDGGTALVTGDVALAGNWGTAPSVSAVTGKDTGGTIEVTSGSGSPGADPTVILTFADGTMGAAPEALVSNRGSTNEGWSMVGSSATTITWRFHGTPAASTVYRLNFLVFGVA